MSVASDRAISTRSWFSEAVNRKNLEILALVSAFLTGVDTIQSFYLQRVINEFNEVNLLPLKFYSTGAVGYLLYAPIDFLVLYATLTMLWIWASYMLWYTKLFILPRFRE
jgi:hypothetical protein